MKLLPNLQAFLSFEDNKDALQKQRERILLNILLVMSALGLILLGNNALLNFQEKRWVTLAIYIAIYVWTLSSTVFTRLPYSYRTFSLISIIFILGTVSLFQDGLIGNGRVYLITFSIITGILLGTRYGFAAIFLSSFTLAAYNFMIFNGSADPAISLTDSGEYLSSYFLVQSLLAFSIVSIVITVSVNTLLNVLSKSLEKEKNLAVDLQKERLQLAANIAKRTADLERRLIQIHTAAEITRSISSMLDPEILLQRVVDLIKERFDLYYVGVFILDNQRDFAVLRAATGEAGEKMLESGHRLAVGGSSMIGWTTLYRKPRIALDVGLEAVRFSNPHLPLTRSEAALPLVIGDRSLGALTIQSSTPEAFDEDDITVLQGIADSLATALENSNLFKQTQDNLEEIRYLHKQYLTKAWADFDLPESNMSYTFENPQAPPLDATGILTIPIKLRDQIIGQVEIERPKADLTAEEKVYIDTLTTETAVALENVRLLRETQLRAERERLVSEVAGKVRASLEVDTVLQTILREVGRILRASGGTIQLDLKDPQTPQNSSNGHHGPMTGEA
jgi:GAF domain-containing protein